MWYPLALGSSLPQNREIALFPKRLKFKSIPRDLPTPQFLSVVLEYKAAKQTALWLHPPFLGYLLGWLAPPLPCRSFPCHRPGLLQTTAASYAGALSVEWCQRQLAPPELASILTHVSTCWGSERHSPGPSVQHGAAASCGLPGHVSPGRGLVHGTWLWFELTTNQISVGN